MTNTTRAASMMERLGGVSNFSGYETGQMKAIHEGADNASKAGSRLDEGAATVSEAGSSLKAISWKEFTKIGNKGLTYVGAQRNMKPEDVVGYLKKANKKPADFTVNITLTSSDSTLQRTRLVKNGYVDKASFALVKDGDLYSFEHYLLHHRHKSAQSDEIVTAFAIPAEQLSETVSDDDVDQCVGAAVQFDESSEQALRKLRQKIFDYTTPDKEAQAARVLAYLKERIARKKGFGKKDLKPVKTVKFAKQKPQFSGDSPFYRVIAFTDVKGDLGTNVGVVHKFPKDMQTRNPYWGEAGTTDKNSEGFNQYETMASIKKAMTDHLSTLEVHANVKGGANESAPLQEATRYNVDGEELTKGQMLKKAVAKSIDFMGGKDKPTYHAITSKNSDGSDGVFAINRREFDRLKVKDETTDRSKEKFTKIEISRLLNDMSMGDKIEFNTWAKSQSRTPSAEDKLAYLKQKFESGADLTERMIDSKKVDRDELQTSTARTLNALEKAGYKVKFDADTGEGELMYKGLKVGFEAGGENLYLDMPRMFTKEAPEETVEALTDLLDVISNFGGTVR